MLYGFNQSDAHQLVKIARREGQRPRNQSTIADPAVLPDDDLGAVEFVNAAGETIPAYSVMRITTPTTVDGVTLVNVAKPDGTYRWRYLINGPNDVADGKMGYGMHFTRAAGNILYDTASTPAVDEEWGPKSGEWKLFQNRPGFVLDGRYDSTAGTLWAMQVVPQELLVKNDTGSDKAAGTTTTFNLYGGAVGSEATLGLSVANCYNRTSVSFKNGKFGMIARIAGKVYVSPQET